MDSVDDVDSVNQASDTDTFYANQLVIQLKETYGQIKVLSKKIINQSQRHMLKYLQK